MKDHQEVLEDFGKYLMRYCRDRSLAMVARVLQGTIKSPNHKSVGERLQTLTEEERKAVEDLAKLVFNETAFQFEQFLNEHKKYKLLYVDDGAAVDLLDLGDGLFGEMFGEYGWIKRYSQFDGKDYF